MRNHLRQRFGADVGVGFPSRQLLQEFDRGVIAVGRLAFQAAADDRAQGFGNRGVNVGSRARLLARALHEAGDGGVGLVGSFSGEQFVEDQADAENVGALVERAAQSLLGRHVFQRADDGAGLGHAGIAERARQAEVHHHDAAVLVAHDVLRLQVAMDHAFGMSGVERAADLLHDRDGFLRRELSRRGAIECAGPRRQRTPC